MSAKKKLSGAENRKRAAQKQVQGESFLKKVPKINTFFNNVIPEAQPTEQILNHPVHEENLNPETNLGNTAPTSDRPVDFFRGKYSFQ